MAVPITNTRMYRLARQRKHGVTALKPALCSCITPCPRPPANGCITALASHVVAGSHAKSIEDLTTQVSRKLCVVCATSKQVVLTPLFLFHAQVLRSYHPNSIPDACFPFQRLARSRGERFIFTGCMPPKFEISFKDRSADCGAKPGLGGGSQRPRPSFTMCEFHISSGRL